MARLRVSTSWLGDEMARALSAMCPPLETADVVRAADTLAAARSQSMHAIDQLLRAGADLMTARRVAEALCALRDAHVSDSDLANWLLTAEAGPEADTARLSAAAERVCQKLCGRLSSLISSDGSHGILSRALHLARTDFPFLAGVHARTQPEVCLEGLAESTRGIERHQAGKGLRAVLSIVLDLLAGLIGEDLAARLVQEVWPDVRVGESRGAGPVSTFRRDAEQSTARRRST
ncbi:MAG: hypothetical protein ACR2IK_05925 [Chloroflexota bacterium]